MTPWGQSDTQREVAPGITSHSTASHGGYHLDRQRQARVEKRFPAFRTFAGGPWYEEDQDWAVVALAFPEHFDAYHLRHALLTARHIGGCVTAWIESLDGASIRIRVGAWITENAENYEVGSLASAEPYPAWNVQLMRIGDGQSTAVRMASYPAKSIYRPAEVEAFQAEAAAR